MKPSSSDTKDISIIVPTYNSARTVARCYQSIIAQENTPTVEVLFIDDGSTDETPSILEHFKGIRLFRFDSNSGPARVRNFGIREAVGGYILFLDSDDTLLPDALQRMWRQVEEHPGVDVVFGRTETWPVAGLKKRYLNLNQLGIKDFSDQPKEVRRAWSKLPDMNCNCLIRRQWLLDNNLLFSNLRSHEDFDRYLRAYGKVGSYSVVKGGPTYLYTLAGNSLSSNLTDAQNRRAVFDILARNIPTRERLDGPAMRIIVNQLLQYKFADTDDSYDRVLRAIREHPSAGRRHRLILLAVKLYFKGAPRRPFLSLLR